MCIRDSLYVEQGVINVDVPDLVEVQGSVNIYSSNSTLESLSFGSLTTIGGTLDVESTELLVDLGGFSSLTSVYGLYIAGNYGLESIDLPDLGVLDSVYI